MFLVALRKVTLVDANTLLLQCLVFEVANIVSVLLDVTPGQS